MRSSTTDFNGLLGGYGFDTRLNHAEPITRKCFSENFFKIHRKLSVPRPLLNKVACREKEALVEVFSRELCKAFHSSLFIDHL